MGEEKTDGSGDTSVRVKSKCIEIGDRKLFEVELHPGETTIVSWKRLLKDANKTKKEGVSSVLDPSTAPSNPGFLLPSALDSILQESFLHMLEFSTFWKIEQYEELPIIEEQYVGHIFEAKTKAEAKESDPPNRFSAVIEKIERLYKGKDSSDEEDLNDFPDDDEYDTEDSFIDDTELDEYFEVDNSAIKHDGFFVNRGKLERVEKPTLQSKEQPKHRKRKDLMRSGTHEGDFQPSKHAKMDVAGSERLTSSLVETSHGISQPLVTGEHGELKLKNGSGSKKRYSDDKVAAEPLPSAKIANGNVSVSTARVKKDKQKNQQSKNSSRKLKDPSGFSNASQHNNHDKTASMQMNPLSERSPKSDNMLNASKRQQEGNGVSEVPDLNIPEGKHATQISKSPNTQRKDGSNVKPKSSILEKAIRDLEKAVEESKPRALENQEIDVSSQAVKRRLPGDIKVKLAKVARLAASHGKLSKELINRLMSSLGHFVQLRTLKRNLKVMITTGLSLKQEKENRFQQIKQEVADMVKMHSPAPDFKVNQQAVSADNLNRLGSEEKGVLKGKKNLDPAIEEKISDLYDLFVDGLDEDAGPQVRKFYVELAALWPTGIMDNHGIKRAICRAKERRREMHSHKDRETTKPRKILPAKIVRSDGNPIPRSAPVEERAAVDPGNLSSGSVNKLNPQDTAGAAELPSPSGHVPAVDAVKKEKIKRKSIDNAREADGSLPKKKVKKKPGVDLNKMPSHGEKLSGQEGEERSKSIKEDASLSQKSIVEPVAISFRRSS